MTNNDVLRGLRFALELDPATLSGMFELASAPLSARHIAALLKNDDEPGFEPLPDALLERFLEGLIAKYRGPRPESVDDAAGGQRVELTNNRILRALKIAFALRDADLLAIMERAGVTLSKPELSALFRRPEHRNYQPCGDQFLRNFLRGLGVWHRQGQPRA